MDTIVAIGDAHWAPRQRLRRASALNRFLKRTEPDEVVIIGDWIDMGSLSRFDTIGSKAMEGTRVRADIESGKAALAALMEDLPDVPLVFVEGNHEERLGRMYAEHPRLEGLADLPGEFEEASGARSFRFVPYRDYYVRSGGLAFTHVPHNNMKPIESVNGVRKVLESSALSVVYGHTHRLDFGTLTRNNGGQIYGLNIGCFIEPQHDPEYMKGRVKDWWRGVVAIRHRRGRPWNGQFSTHSLEGLLGAA